jgi:hypothetical protein
VLNPANKRAGEPTDGIGSRRDLRAFHLKRQLRLRNDCEDGADEKRNCEDRQQHKRRDGQSKSPLSPAGRIIKYRARRQFSVSGDQSANRYRFSILKGSRLDARAPEPPFYCFNIYCVFPFLRCRCTC